MRKTIYDKIERETKRIIKNSGSKVYTGHAFGSAAPVVVLTREGFEMNEEKRKQLIKKTVAKLRHIRETEDTESGHAAADSVLCELLVTLRFEEVVQEYNEQDKWFA